MFVKHTTQQYRAGDAGREEEDQRPNKDHDDQSDRKRETRQTAQTWGSAHSSGDRLSVLHNLDIWVFVIIIVVIVIIVQTSLCAGHSNHLLVDFC